MSHALPRSFDCRQPSSIKLNTKPARYSTAALRSSRSARVVCAVALLALLSACGEGGERGFPGPPGLDSAPSTTGAGTPGVSGSAGTPAPGTAGIGALVLTDGPLETMPQGNRGVIGPIADGADAVLRMRTPADAANPVGAFVGGGVGNKAITGINGFSGMKLTDWAGWSLTPKSLPAPAPTLTSTLCWI